MIKLPRKDKDGRYYISYSQLSSFNEKKGFNTGLSGKIEYIRSYFLGEKFEDINGFATFGQEVESYITDRTCADKFTNKEKEVLETIIPLGTFQKEFKLDFGEFYVLGFIDDCNNNLTKIRDYKTCSKKSGEKYTKDDYYQLDIYAMAIKQETGKLPKELEVCCIEREGNGFKGGRDVMNVANDVWYIQRKTTKERQDYLKKYILETAMEISKYYTIFEKLNRI
jgi:hypothetical protein